MTPAERAQKEKKNQGAAGKGLMKRATREPVPVSEKIAKAASWLKK